MFYTYAYVSVFQFTFALFSRCFLFRLFEVCVITETYSELCCLLYGILHLILKIGNINNEWNASQRKCYFVNFWYIAQTLTMIIISKPFSVWHFYIPCINIYETEFFLLSLISNLATAVKRRHNIFKSIRKQSMKIKDFVIFHLGIWHYHKHTQACLYYVLMIWNNNLCLSVSLEWVVLRGTQLKSKLLSE